MAECACDGVAGALNAVWVMDAVGVVVLLAGVLVGVAWWLYLLWSAVMGVKAISGPCAVSPRQSARDKSTTEKDEDIYLGY